MKNAIKTWSLLLIVLLLGIITSCNDNNDLNNEGIIVPPLTEIEQRLIGGWPDLGDNGVTFFQNGILVHNGEIGHWQYDESKKILTTDIINKQKQVLIWQINMLTSGSMVGIQIWDGSTFSAKRNTIQTVKDILCNSHKTWTRNKNYKFLTIRFSGNFQIENNTIYSMEYDYENKNISKWIGYQDLTVSEQDFTSITITSEEHGNYIIHNPYNYELIWLEFPDKRKYYPVTADMNDLEQINMSKEELKLVGKWICQEQIWDKKLPGHLYFEDDYGMEFYNDYWGKIWAGPDQLMEVMNGDTFTWWIKDNKLYVDNNLYYIQKFTDKELELEWCNGSNIITCKFYKYNENEGLLIDQLEYVDLGLSVNWATRNLGAENLKMSRLGNYYAWGETISKNEYTLDNYKFYQKEDYRYVLTKYCSNPYWGYNNYIDNKTTLDSEDDAAIAVRGKEWRMPTLEEYQELINNCTWEWTYDAYGNSGYKITGKTGYYIFLPAAGYKTDKTNDIKNGGYYLTSSTGEISIDFDAAPITIIYLNRNEDPQISQLIRSAGYSIRPVHK